MIGTSCGGPVPLWYVSRSIALLATSLWFACDHAIAAELIIRGEFKGHYTKIGLEDHEQSEGELTITLFCDLENGFRRGKWRKKGNERHLFEGENEEHSIGIIRGEPNLKSPFGETSWKGEQIRLGTEVSSFEGKSFARNISMKLLPECGTTLEAPGVVAALLDPRQIRKARRYARKRGWTMFHASLRADSVPNGYVFDVPIGSHELVIANLLKQDFVFDAGREPEPLNPGISSVYLSSYKSEQGNINNLYIEKTIQSLVHAAWRDTKFTPKVVPRKKNTVDVTFRGPVLSFVSEPTLPGFWIELELQLLVDPVREGGRMFATVKKARSIRWPEARKGSPPNGYGPRLECGVEGAARNMDVPVALTRKLLEKARDMFGGGEDPFIAEC